MAADPVSSYLTYLPAVLRQSPFLGRFLLAFEAMLSGIDETAIPGDIDPLPEGLERVLDRMDRFFVPAGDDPASRTDPEFLPWLAQWVATSLRDDWDEPTTRHFLANIVPLYRLRGTREGIQKVLDLSGFSSGEVLVVDFFDGLHEAEEMEHFPIVPRPTFYFGVLLRGGSLGPAQIYPRINRVRSIVDREKPAHTFYGLRVLYPALRINDDPTVHPGWGPGIWLRDSEPLVLGTMKP